MSASKQIILVDAMALIYRAHFALYKNPRVTKEGVDTSVILGFTNSLVDVLQQLDPSHAVVAFDSREPTWRHKMYPPYKEHREEQPESISAGIPYIKEIVAGFGIPLVALPGQEADDIIGALAMQAAAAKFHVYIVTPDKDLGQLVNTNVELYKPSLGGRPSVIWGAQEVQEAWGIDRVEQITDMIALAGDASDHIPGIKGIGPKRAQKLIQTYGSLENLLAHLHELKGTYQQNIKEQQEVAIISKKLAKINTNLSIDLTWEEAEYKEPQISALLPIFKKLEFRSLAQRILGKKSNSNQQLDLLGESGLDIVSLTDHLTTIKTSGASYELIDNVGDCQQLVQKLHQQKGFCFDTETTGLDPHQARLLGIAFSYRAKEAFYLTMPEKKEDMKPYWNLLKPLFNNPTITKVGHNLKYDLSVLAQYNVLPAGPFFDTMLAHHLLAPAGQHSLTALANQYLEYAPVEISSLIGEKNKQQKSMASVPLDQLVTYASEDADITWQLYQLFLPKIEQEGMASLFYEIEMPLIPILVDMERAGIAIDSQMLYDISQHLNEDLSKLTASIHGKAGFNFNIDSPKQLGEVLFSKMRIVEKAAKTKTGQYTTNEAVLNKLKKKHAIIPAILAYRELKKLKSTYVDKLPELASPLDGRVHTSYQQGIVTTGRLSSVKPNLQNIPIRTERGRLIRKAFIAEDASHTLLCVDYSQIELRLMAHFSEDEHMLEAFENHVDIHSLTASHIEQIAGDQVTPEMRRKAKMVNFGIIYGISAYGLGERLEIARSEASKIIEAYFERFPKVKIYMERMIAEAKKEGYVKTLWGRKRFLPDINSRNATTRSFAERNAINMPIQGTAAELIKGAMVRITQWIRDTQVAVRMILQVHDELIFEVHQSEVEKAVTNIRRIMEDEKELRVPIEVTIGIGDNWLKAH
ncbi:MAG: DNA polymerase I [Bacteroidota bacterium]